ncbi:MAG: YceI family protein [Cyclobacteriaceae bacterium]|nr:YceI family protein [Cyclobacteriaceae bacterium HetDA_MAG_MS6]
MKMKVLTILIATLPTIALAQSWNIMEGYEIKFSGNAANGSFSNLTGEITFYSEDLSRSKFDVEVQVATISTGNKTKDKHARGNSWFDADQYPTIRFSSEEFSALSNTGEFSVSGTLDMHGVKKEMNIPFTFFQEGDEALFKGGFTVNRKDFEILGPIIGFMVGDEFEVMLEVPVKQ